MTDETGFEPRLGKIDSDSHRRRKTQLRALSKLARHGKPLTSGRTKLPSGTLRFQARGKGASFAARLGADPARRRVMVRTMIAAAPQAHPEAYRLHLAYLRREGTDRDGSPSPLFDAASDEASERAFRNRSRDDSHQFRILVAPDDSGRMEDLAAFTRSFMRQVERDLGTPLDWIAARHFNTAQAHIHIVIRGGNDRDGKLYIDRQYILHGLRHRSEDLVTRELGFKSPQETMRLQHGLTCAQRLTSIDRELARAAEGDTLVLVPSGGPRERHGWQEKFLRLTELRRLGLARHVHANRWTFAPGWTGTLTHLGERSATLEVIAHSAGRTVDPLSVEAPSPGSLGGWITGRFAGLIDAEAPPAARRLLLEGLDGRLWAVPASDSDLAGLPEQGGVLSVYKPSPAPEQRGSTRTASPSPDAPLMIQVNSWLAISVLTDRLAFTWLDEISAADVDTLSNGFGAEVRAAWRARKVFLQAEGLSPPDREELMAREMQAVSTEEAKRSGRRHVLLDPREIFRGDYVRDLDTAQGRFAVIASESRFVLAPITEDFAGLKGKALTVERAPRSHDLLLSRGRSLGR